mmetsp:Transcript_50220/g.109856  ORF Transcript_50220/g.109856 Transcript_50220/m.109856 type:complete len:257 (-) Transcript_50220:735-1505(-)
MNSSGWSRADETRAPPPNMARRRLNSSCADASRASTTLSARAAAADTLVRRASSGSASCPRNSATSADTAVSSPARSVSLDSSWTAGRSLNDRRPSATRSARSSNREPRAVRSVRSCSRFSSSAFAFEIAAAAAATASDNSLTVAKNAAASEASSIKSSSCPSNSDAAFTQSMTPSIPSVMHLWASFFKASRRALASALCCELSAMAFWNSRLVTVISCPHFRALSTKPETEAINASTAPLSTSIGPSARRSYVGP